MNITIIPDNYPKSFRTIGINNIAFGYDDNYMPRRENVWYYSEQFEKILAEYEQTLDADLLSEYNRIKTSGSYDLLVQKLFNKCKD